MSESEDKRAEKTRRLICFSPWKDQKGVTAIVVGLMIIPLMGFVALAVDIGYYMVTRNQLQNIADGAALAACRQLGHIYQEMTPQEQNSYVCSADDQTLIRSIAQQVGLNNNAGGTTGGITIKTEDIIIGDWDGTNLTPTLNQPDAVRVNSAQRRNCEQPHNHIFCPRIGDRHSSSWDGRDGCFDRSGHN